MSALSFTDEELALLNALASPLPPPDRASFLRLVASELAAHLPGAARRVCLLYQLAVAVQHEFLRSGPVAVGGDGKFGRSQRRGRYG